MPLRCRAQGRSLKIACNQSRLAACPFHFGWRVAEHHPSTRAEAPRPRTTSTSSSPASSRRPSLATAWLVVCQGATPYELPDSRGEPVAAARSLHTIQESRKGEVRRYLFLDTRTRTIGLQIICLGSVTRAASFTGGELETTARGYRPEASLEIRDLRP